MIKVDTSVMHDEHRQAQAEHALWLEDIARWRQEHSRAAAMLEAVKVAWSEARPALDEHARQIRALHGHAACHEQAFRSEGPAMDAFESESIVSEHQYFQVTHDEVRQAHAEMQRLYAAVSAEVLELLKLTHPGAVVLETDA